MKILLFGGTFDPPHNGHIALLQHMVDALAPDLALIMPAGIPPHKHAYGTPGQLRFEMCKDLLQAAPCVHRSRHEIDCKGKSYTVDTLRWLAGKYPGAQLYFAMGSDMLLSFTGWHEWRQILQLATLVCQSRDDEDTAALQPAIQKLTEAGGRVQFVAAPVLRLSSTQLRGMVGQGKDISGMVPKSAAAVICRHHLYRKGTGFMVDAAYCKKLAKRNLSERRYQHTLNVAKLAKKLAKQYGADPEKAEISGLLHDICKELPKDELLQMLRENAIMTNNAADKPAGIWHAAAAMVYLANNLGIQDEEILNAVRWHTCGRAGMTLLDKIIYMADMCSAERDYREAEELRRLLDADLDRAVTKALSYSIQWLKEEKREIDPDSVAALADMRRQYCADEAGLD